MGGGNFNGKVRADPQATSRRHNKILVLVRFLIPNSVLTECPPPPDRRSSRNVTYMSHVILYARHTNRRQLVVSALVRGLTHEAKYRPKFFSCCDVSDWVNFRKVPMQATAI